MTELQQQHEAESAAFSQMWNGFEELARLGPDGLVLWHPQNCSLLQLDDEALQLSVPCADELTLQIVSDAAQAERETNATAHRTLLHAMQQAEVAEGAAAHATATAHALMQALRATAWLGSYLIRPSAKRGLHGGARARHRLRTKASSSLHAVAAPLRLRRGAALRARILRAMTREPHTTTAYLATPEAALSAILLPAAAWATASRLSTQPSSVHLSSVHPLPWSQCFELHKTKFG